MTDPGTSVRGWFQQLTRAEDDAESLESRGLPPRDARRYEQQVRQGRVLVVARADQDPDHVADTLRDQGAGDVGVYGQHVGAWVGVDRTPRTGRRTYERLPYHPGAPSSGPATQVARESGHPAGPPGTSQRGGGTSGGRVMTTARQQAAARRNIKKAAAAAKSKRTIAHLPAKTRTALGKKGAIAARTKKRGRR